MVNRQQIVECWNELVGWNESAKAGTCYDELTDSLKESTSGVYVNDLEGVTLELVNDTYGPDYDNVNDYLADIHNAAMLELANDFIIKQKSEVYTKSLIKNGDLGVNFSTNIRNKVIKNNRFVGYEIRPKKSNSIRADVIQFGGMFDTAQAGLPIYFYSDKQMEALGTFTVDITKENSLEWYNIQTSGSGSASSSATPAETPLQFICNYINKNTGHGQRYYIGYYESDLTGQAIMTQTPCYSCGSGNVYDFKKYVDISPIEVSAGSTYVDRGIFNTDAVGYTNETYGLFIKLNVLCDTTQALCDNKDLFAHALQKKIAAKILWRAWGSTKLNKVSGTMADKWRMLAEKYEQELKGYTQDGVYIKGELETLTIDFSNIDAVCLGNKKNVFGVMQL
jgi:hypothetical protein